MSLIGWMLSPEWNIRPFNYFPPFMLIIKRKYVSKQFLSALLLEWWSVKCLSCLPSSLCYYGINKDGLIYIYIIIRIIIIIVYRLLNRRFNEWCFQCLLRVIKICTSYSVDMARYLFVYLKLHLCDLSCNYGKYWMFEFYVEFFCAFRIGLLHHFYSTHFILILMGQQFWFMRFF